MEVHPVFLDKLSTEIRVSYIRASLRDYLKPRAYITVSWRRRCVGMGLGWNSVFLYGKHFAFRWDRASCGSGLDFSVLRYYMQGYQHTGWPFSVTGIAGSVLGWESCWPVCGCVFFCLSKQTLKQYHFRLLHSSCLSSPFVSSAVWSAASRTTGRLQANAT
jgi:hypothetical protein